MNGERRIWACRLGDRHLTSQVSASRRPCRYRQHDDGRDGEHRVTVHFRLSADGGTTVLDGWCIIVVRLRHITYK
jgi:hypothetical protein